MTDMTLVRAFPGRFIAAQGRSLSNAATTPALNMLIALPFDAGGAFDQATAFIKTAGSGDAVMRVGIYDKDVTGLPGTLIEDLGEYSASVADQIDMPFSEPLTFTSPFWVVALFGGTTAPAIQSSAAIPAIEIQHLFGMSGAQMSAGIFSGSNAVISSYTYDALPTEFPTPTLSTSSMLLVVRTATPSE